MGKKLWYTGIANTNRQLRKQYSAAERALRKLKDLSPELRQRVYCYSRVELRPSRDLRDNAKPETILRMYRDELRDAFGSWEDSVESVTPVFLSENLWDVTWQGKYGDTEVQFIIPMTQADCERLNVLKEGCSFEVKERTIPASEARTVKETQVVCSR